MDKYFNYTLFKFFVIIWLLLQLANSVTAQESTTQKCLPCKQVYETKKYCNGKFSYSKITDSLGPNIIGERIIKDYPNYYYIDSSLIPFTGTCIDYYPDSTIKLKENFFYGTRHGEYAEYFQNGQLKELGNYWFDMKNGTWQTWEDSVHSVLEEENYEYGIECCNYNKYGISLSFKKGLFGLKDTTGKVILPHKYFKIYFYTKPAYDVYITENDTIDYSFPYCSRKMGLVNAKGKEIFPCKYYFIQYLPGYRDALISGVFDNGNNIETKVFDIKKNKFKKGSYDRLGFSTNSDDLSPHLIIQDGSKMYRYPYFVDKTKKNDRFPWWHIPLKPLNLAITTALLPLFYPVFYIGYIFRGSDTYTLADYYRNCNLTPLRQQKYKKIKHYIINKNGSIRYLNKDEIEE